METVRSERCRRTPSVHLPIHHFILHSSSSNFKMSFIRLPFFSTAAPYNSSLQISICVFLPAPQTPRPPPLPRTPSPPLHTPSAYNRRRLPSQGAGNGVEVQESVIMMSLHKHGAARGCLDEASGDASGKLPRPSWERPFATQPSKNGGETKTVWGSWQGEMDGVAVAASAWWWRQEDEKAVCLPSCPSA